MNIQQPLGFSSKLNRNSDAWINGEQPDGFKFIELVAEYQPSENDEIKEQCLQRYREDYERANQQDLKVWSVHLPYGAHLDLTVDSDRSEEIVRNFAVYVDQTIAMGTHCYVVHVFQPEPLEFTDRNPLLQRANHNIKLLGEYIASKGAILAVEALPRTNLGNTSDECLRMIQGTAAGICLDVNHLLIENHHQFISAAYPHICTVHLSDYDFVDEKHWVPGEGKLDWKNLLALFQESGYNGPLMFEVTSHKNGEKLFLKDIRDGFLKAIK